MRLDQGTVAIEQIENGNWMYVATMNDGIHFQIGVEATAAAAQANGESALRVQRQRRAIYEEMTS